MARSYSSVESDIRDFVGRTEEKMLGVLRGALLDVTNDAQREITDGGRMPVITGFLRASGRANLNGWPIGPTDKPKDTAPNSYTWDGEAVATTLFAMEMGDTFHFGWTAVYAGTQEYNKGFLEAAMQNWQQHVNNNIRKAEKAGG